MGIKIQLNSLEALERLIGGDSEIEIEIRNSVAEKFSQKYLKSLAQSLLDSGANSAIKDVLTKQNYLKEGRSWETKHGPKLRELVSKMIESSTKQIIAEAVTEGMKSNELVQKVNQSLEAQAKFIADQLTSENLNKRLDAMVDKRLKEKLNIL